MHTLNPGCAHAACALLPGQAHSVVSWLTPASYRGRARPCRRTHWLCHRPCSSTHWLCRRPCRARTLPCRRPPPVTIQSLYRNTTPTARAVRHVSGSCCAVSPPCCAISRHQTITPNHDTILVSRLIPWPGHQRAHAPLAPVRRPTVSWGRVAGAPGRIVAPLLHSPTPYVTIQSIVS